VARARAARAAERAKARADKESLQQAELDRFLREGRAEYDEAVGAHRAP
jgi:hypothetical protein